MMLKALFILLLLGSKGTSLQAQVRTVSASTLLERESLSLDEPWSLYYGGHHDILKLPRRANKQISLSSALDPHLTSWVEPDDQLVMIRYKMRMDEPIESLLSISPGFPAFALYVNGALLAEQGSLDEKQGLCGRSHSGAIVPLTPRLGYDIVIKTCLVPLPWLFDYPRIELFAVKGYHEYLRKKIPAWLGLGLLLGLVLAGATLSQSSLGRKAKVLLYSLVVMTTLLTQMEPRYGLISYLDWEANWDWLGVVAEVLLLLISGANFLIVEKIADGRSLLRLFLLVASLFFMILSYLLWSPSATLSPSAIAYYTLVASTWLTMVLSIFQSSRLSLKEKSALTFIQFIPSFALLPSSYSIGFVKTEILLLWVAALYLSVLVITNSRKA